MNRHQMWLSASAVAVTAATSLAVSAIASPAKLEVAAINPPVVGDKATIFAGYTATAAVYCFLRGSVSGREPQEVASLFMRPGCRDWTRIATYKNGRDAVRIDAIQVFSNGKLVKSYTEQPVTLGESDVLQVYYAPSSLWNSGGRLEGDVLSEDGPSHLAFTRD